MTLKKFLKDDEIPECFDLITGKARGNSFTITGHPKFTFPLHNSRGKRIGDAEIKRDEWAGKIFERPRISKKLSHGMPKILFGEARYGK